MAMVWFTTTDKQQFLFNDPAVIKYCSTHNKCDIIYIYLTKAVRNSQNISRFNKVFADSLCGKQSMTEQATKTHPENSKRDDKTQETFLVVNQVFLS